jgi:hypothetical protein
MSALPSDYAAVEEWEECCSSVARTGKFPESMSIAVQHQIEADPQAFDERVRLYRYAIAMEGVAGLDDA